MPDENLIKLGNHVKQIRKERKMSQQKLSDISGLAVRTISKIERGKMNPSYEVLSTLVSVLGISFDSLFTFTNNQISTEIQEIERRYSACSEQGRRLILASVRALADELMDE